MSTREFILADITRHPTDWFIECPKCGSIVNAKYAFSLAPTLGVEILPHFYCHCARYQIMNPRPAKLYSAQTTFVICSFFFALLVRMTIFVLRKK